MKQKFLSILIALIMMLSFVPISAWAASDGSESSPWLVSTADDLKTAVEAGGYISLQSDIQIDEPLNITKTIIIDGGSKTGAESANGSNCYSITTTASGEGSRVFNVDGSSTALAFPLNITFQNVQVIGPTSGAYTRGLSIYQADGDVNITLKNAKLTAGYYALNIASNNTDVEVEIDRSTLEGWCAFQLWSPATVNVTDSTLKGINDKGYNKEGWNNFSTIVVNQDATQSKINISDSTILAKTTNGNFQQILSIQNVLNTGEQEAPVGNSITFTNCTLETEGNYKVTAEDNQTSEFPLYPAYYAEGGNTLIIDGKEFYIPEEDEGVYQEPLDAVAQIGNIYFGSLSTAVAAAQADDTIILLKDVTISDMLITRKTMTLNLGGNTLTATDDSYAVAAVAGTLTVQNGTLDVTSDNGTALYAQQATIVVDDGAVIKAKGNAVQVGNCVEGSPGVYWGKVIVNDGASINGDAGILVSGPYPVSALQSDGTLSADQSNRSTLTVNGGTITGTAYAITGNGTYHGTEITVNGGTIKQTGNVGGGALYHPQNGTLNISGDPVFEGESGIQLCSGEGVIANITGGTIRATGSDDRASKTGDGFIPDGAALSVVNRNYPGGTPKMTVSGGYFSSEKSDAVLAYTWSNNNASEWTEAKQYLNITGGYFTSDPSVYTAEGKTGVDSGLADYPYTVGTEGDGVVPVAPAASDVQTPTVSYEEGSAEKTLLDSAQSALSGDNLSTEGTGLQAAAKTQANNNTTTVTDDIVSALDAVVSGDTVTTEDTYIVVQPYTQMTITGVDATAGQQSITLEIQPMYRTVATTVDLETTPNTDIILDEEDGAVNAVVVGEPKPLTVTGPVEITIPLPDGFTTDGNGLVVKHEKNGALVGYHATEYDSDNNTITFTNDKGFSSFTVLADTRSATVQFTDKDSNNIGSAETYGPADVNGALPTTAAPSGQVFNGWTFEGITGTYTTLTDELLTELNGKGTVNATPSFYTPSSGGSSTYSITVQDTAYGTVVSSSSRASRGTTVTVTVTPDEGYALNTLTVTDADGNAVSVTKVSDTKYTFVMPRSKVTVSASFALEELVSSLPFTDVAVDDWFYSAVEYAYDNGLMAGTSTTTFEPNATLTRGMMVTVLWAMEDGPVVNYAMSYSDVASGDWYAEAVRWATSVGVTNGVGDNTFAPNDALTREQMAVMLYAYSVVKGYDTTQGACPSGSLPTMTTFPTGR